MEMEITRLIHISCVALSGLFFFVRGLAVIQRSQLVGQLWVRRTAESIDTILLMSGVTLAWLSDQTPWQESWLAVKLIALLVYILLGMVAFHWGRVLTIKSMAWIAAMVTYLFMIWVAVNRDPWPFEVDFF